MSHYPDAKYPISDEEMLSLLHKYPFLRFRNVWSGEQTYHGKSKNLESNYYKYWDGYGWEDLWKNRYLPRLFAEYDTWDKETQKRFGFTQVKEKFGNLRIYTTFGSDKRLESIAEWLSEYICEYCGKETRTEEGKRVIWTTGGWITNLCEHCAREYILRNAEGELSEADIQKYLNEMKCVQEKPFGYIQFGKDKNLRVSYKEIDNWLEKDKEEYIDKDET